MRIVIVEDEYIIREGIAKTLIKINNKYEVVGQGKNGIEGLELIEATKPDLVITDIKMVKMDGLEMLTALRDMGIKVKTIILSAYSEFEYAQKAIFLDVSEYILKPISILDLSSALERIENQLSYDEKTKTKHPKVLYQLDNILLSSALGSLEMSEELNIFLEKQYNFSSTDEFGIFEIYLGELFDGKINELKRELISISKHEKELKFNNLELKQEKMLILILCHLGNKKEIQNYFIKNIIPIIRSRISKDFAYGLIFSNGLLEINDKLKKLKNELHFNLTIGVEHLINYHEINNIKTKEFLYPIEIENKMKFAIVKHNKKNINEISKAFIKYCREEIYRPTDVKEACINFSWAVINTAKELDALLYENLDVQFLLKKIMSAITWKEIEDTYCKLFGEILESNLEKDNEVISLVVKRAQSLIYEYYNQGINLEEIAIKLNITADYLGKQFKKEIGESFNSYIKNYRINKVKTLLLGTELKVYEIAELTGYADSKYMSKVFKEETRYLPNDYRKIYK